MNDETNRRKLSLPSHTPAILEYLQRMEIGKEFTSKDVKAGVPTATKGSISGFLTKCVDAGMIERAGWSKVDGGQGRRNLVYRMVDPAKDVSASVWSSHGGAAGRTIVQRERAPLPPWLANRDDTKLTPHALMEKLLALAGEVETMQPDLSNVHIDVLLAEVKRRTGSD